MKKKIFILALFSLVCFFITDTVNAESFSLTAPNQIFIAQDNGGVSVSPQAGDWWGKRIYAGGYYSYAGSTDYFPGGVAWVWDNVSICPNEDMLLKISLYTDGSETFFNVVGGTLWINGSQCVATENGGYYKTFSCSSVGVSNSTLNIAYNPENIVTGYTGIGFGYDIDLTCNPTTASVIQNQNQNTQDVINNVTQNVQNIINNQTQNQQQTNEKLDDINDSLTNSNVEGGTGSSFFNDFSTSDNGGISSIITAPLVAINSMLDNTCNPMTATWRGKEISFPCGTEFWAKASTIQDYLNWFEGGILVYLIIRKLYKLIESMKNPDDDRVEVMDL